MGAPQQKKKRKQKENSFATIASHRLRLRCWTRLTERTASPKELSHELRASLSDVSYHVEVLHKLGAIELVRTKPVRGAVQHWYRSVVRPHMSIEEIAKLSQEEQTNFARHICQLAFADAAIALEAGTYCARPEHHATRIPMEVDEEGWQELFEIHEEMFQRRMQVQANCVERRALNPDLESIPVTSVGLLFERST